MGQRFRRVIQVPEGISHLSHRARALLTHEKRTQNRGEQNNRQRWPQADYSANLDEQGDFDQRYRDKCQQKCHNILV